ncbi:uncharacterized protein LOC111265556 isoform X1 [Varroa jacobsoni]|uniref:uncharacterized protein LOC111265556 isoform X1 n=1 Tax=Varroa jacobsoni TaxID=62625 RepID=UPI000BF74676|nr:uncharacterized protein LOC111265556 isoform X1 [Varroa jacobsoni]
MLMTAASFTKFPPTMEITASRRILKLNFRKKANKVPRKNKSLLEHLYHLAKHDRLPDRKISSTIHSDLNDIIEFRSQKEADNFPERRRYNCFRRSQRKLPLVRNISDDVFNRLKESIQQKSEDETLQEYLAVSKKLRKIPDEVHESTARDLNDENEWPDLDDDYESSSEDEASVVSETTLDQDDTVDSESTSDVDDKDFTLIEDADKAVNLTECVLLPESNSIPFEIRSRTRRRNMGIISENVLTEHRSHDQDSLCNALKNSCCVVLQRLNDSDISCCKPSVDDLANIPSAFDPPSCSSSISQSSLNNDDMRTHLELGETAKTIDHTTETHVFADLADENTFFNVAQGKPTIQAPSSEPQTPKSNKKTAPNKLGTLTLASLSRLSTLASPGNTTETPSQKRLRELGILSKLRRKIESPSSTSHRSTYSDSKCAKRNNLSNNETYNSNTIIKRFATIDIASTPKKRSRHSTSSKQLERTVQVFATPSRPFRTLEDAMAPTIDLTHLIEIRSVPRRDFTYI